MKRPSCKSIIQSMPYGYALHRFVLDKRGHPCDYIFIEVSSLFEAYSGLKANDIIGKRVTEALKLDDDTVSRVRVAGALHDIGKIGISENILNKEGPLDQSEWEIMKQHPLKSARILTGADEYSEIVPIVKSHHERFDGSGYPDGLKGENIPLESRIICIADAYDAMTFERP